MAQDYVIEPASAKVEVVAELRELVAGTQATILADYRGLSVAELTDLRKKLRGVDAEFRVVKNTLFKRAADGLLPIQELEPFLTGPTAIGFAKGDPIGAAKVMVDFVREHKAISLKAGVVDGVVYNVAKVEALAKTPPREQLIAAVLGSLNAPMAGLVGALNNVCASLVWTLQAVVDQKSAAA